MIFGIIIIAAVAGIAYYHYAQGFFSATFSAIIAIIAAALAISYHEQVVMGLLGGKMADFANALVLVAIFALVYIVLRTITDKAVPGQIRLPVIVDRIGGGAMGVVAGVFTAGIFALAAQSLPFGPAIGGYARFGVEDRPELTIPPNPGQSSQTTADVNEQLKSDTFLPEDASKLIIPVDDWVLNAVNGLSNGGSLAGDRTLASIHPNYADELFAQRLGVQLGAKHVAVNLDTKSQQVTVPDPGVFRLDTDLNKAIVDAELPTLHQRAITTVKPQDSADKMQLVVRVMFGKDAADTDGNVRLSPASVRLVANGRNYFPIGTLENGNLLYANKVDDSLFVNVQAEDRGADFVFLVNPADIATGDPKQKDQKISDGVFIEVKRLARVDLSGKPVKVGVTPAKMVKVERKAAVSKQKEKGAGAEASAAAAAAEAGGPPAGFVYASLDVSKQIFSPINTGTPDKDVKNAQVPSGTLSLQSGQFTQLDINTTQTLTLLKQGSYATSELFEPTGMKLVQVKGTPPPEGGDPWAWGTLRNFALLDAAGKTYAPAGAWAKVKRDQSDRMVARYNASAAPQDISAEEGRPTDVWIAFLVPSGTHLKEVKFSGKTLAPLEQVIP
jgi:hypothetical protein